MSARLLHTHRESHGELVALSSRSADPAERRLPLGLPDTAALTRRTRPSPGRSRSAPCLQAAIDVRLEDQQKINTFSRLNTKLHELEAQLAGKKVWCGAVRGGGNAGLWAPPSPPSHAGCTSPPPPFTPALPSSLTTLTPTPSSPHAQADAEDLEEAGNEVMLLDDETAPHVVGECLVHLPREQVEEKLQQGGCSAPPPLLCCVAVLQLWMRCDACPAIRGRLTLPARPSSSPSPCRGCKQPWRTRRPGYEASRGRCGR